jgi:Ca2+-binding EF-hand superfamily protein
VQEAYSALGVASSTRVSKEDFCSLLGGGRNLSASPGSAKKMKNNIDRYQQNNAEYQKLIAQFAQELKNQNTTPLRFFKRADYDNDKVLTVEELKNAAKEYNLEGMNYIKLMMAFDVSGNNIVE